MEYTKKNSTEKDQEIQEVLQDLFDAYEDEGPVFMFSIFLNGLVNIIGMYSIDAASAQKTLKDILDRLSESVDEMEKVGMFSSSSHLQ